MTGRVERLVVDADCYLELLVVDGKLSTGDFVVELGGIEVFRADLGPEVPDGS